MYDVSRKNLIVIFMFCYFVEINCFPFELALYLFKNKNISFCIRNRYVPNEYMNYTVRFLCKICKKKEGDQTNLLEMENTGGKRKIIYM